MRFQPRDRDVVWEVSDGEVLLIDLARGVYYSARQGTAQLVHDVLCGLSTEESLTRWTERSPSTVTQAQDRLCQVVEVFLRDGLVSSRTQAPDNPPAVLDLDSEELPDLEVYDDMKEIFEMDPIHEGDLQQGWPVHN